MGRKSEGEDGIVTFFSASICNLRQCDGKIPLEIDTLNNLVRCEAIVGMLWLFYFVVYHRHLLLVN